MQRFIVFCLLFSGIGFSCFAQQMQFKYMESSHGITNDGHPGSSQAFEASDGTWVYKRSENRDSAILATKVLNKRVQSAVKILEQSPEFNKQGKQTGKRIVALFADKNSNEAYVSIFWTYEEKLFEIKASSLQTALEFEKQFYGAL